MCTYLTEKVSITGSGKGPVGWFSVTDASVYFDHPVHAPAEHTLNIDFLDPGAGPSARVQVELTAAVVRRQEQGRLGELPESLPQGSMEAARTRLGSLVAALEVGARDRVDEERVAGEHGSLAEQEPGHVAGMAGQPDDAHRLVTEFEQVTVGYRRDAAGVLTAASQCGC